MKTTKDFWLGISIATLFWMLQMPLDDLGKTMLLMGVSTLVLTLIAYIY